MKTGFGHLLAPELAELESAGYFFFSLLFTAGDSLRIFYPPAVLESLKASCALSRAWQGVLRPLPFQMTHPSKAISSEMSISSGKKEILWLLALDLMVHPPPSSANEA